MQVQELVNKKDFLTATGTGFIGSIAANEVHQNKEEIIKHAAEFPIHLDDVKDEIISKIPSVLDNVIEYLPRILPCMQLGLISNMITLEDKEIKDKEQNMILPVMAAMLMVNGTFITEPKPIEMNEIKPKFSFNITTPTLKPLKKKKKKSEIQLRYSRTQ